MDAFTFLDSSGVNLAGILGWERTGGFPGLVAGARGIPPTRGGDWEEG